MLHESRRLKPQKCPDREKENHAGAMFRLYLPDQKYWIKMPANDLPISFTTLQDAD